MCKAVRFTPQGSVIVAEGAIAKGEIVMAIPTRLQIREIKADQALIAGAAFPQSVLPTLERLAAAVPTEMWAMRLALYLLVARADASSCMWPYIGALPKTFGLPMFFSLNEVAAASNTTCRHRLDLPAG